MLNCPAPLVVSVRVTPVLSSVTLICARDTTAPCGSATVPVIAPLPPCANAQVVNANSPRETISCKAHLDPLPPTSVTFFICPPNAGEKLLNCIFCCGCGLMTPNWHANLLPPRNHCQLENW